MAALIVEHWWSRRSLIAKVAGASFLVFCILILLIPKQFRTNATIIIIPPRFQSEIRTEALSVTTAKNLLMSDEIILQVIERIRTAKKIFQDANMPPDQFALLSPEQITADFRVKDEQVATYLSKLTPQELNCLLDLPQNELDDWTVQDLGKSMETEEIIEKKTASDIKFSPLLSLYVKSNTGPLAQLIANTWAGVFENKYDQLTTQKTRQQRDSIEKQQRASVLELEDIQTTIVEFKAKNNLEYYLRQIDQYMDIYNQFNGQLVQKRNTIRTEQAKLAEYMNLLQFMEIDGRWAGRAYVENELTTSPQFSTLSSSPSEAELAQEFSGSQLTSGPVVATARVDLSGDNLSDVPTDQPTEVTEYYRNVRRETVESRNRLRIVMSEYMNFYSQTPVQLMEQRRERMTKDFIESYSRLRTGKVGLEVLKSSLAAADQQLSQTEQFLVLYTAVPDVTISEAVARREGMRDLASIQFKRQELNPKWTMLQEQSVGLRKAFENAKFEVEQLSLDVPAKEKELEELDLQIQSAKMNEQFIKQSLEGWQKHNSEMFQEYVASKKEVYRTAQSISMLQAEIARLDRTTSETRTKAEEFQRLYDRSSADLHLLEARQRALQRNADMLLQKLQEAKIAVSEETSDVSIAAGAITPSRHYFPPRTILVLALTLLTLAVLLGLLGRARYMEVVREAPATA